MQTEHGYENDYLDKVIAVMAMIVFLVAAGFCVLVVIKHWVFFQWLAGLMVLVFCVWITALGFNFVHRIHAQNQAIYANADIEMKWGNKKEPLKIYDYSKESFDYNEYLIDEDDED